MPHAWPRLSHFVCRRRRRIRPFITARFGNAADAPLGDRNTPVREVLEDVIVLHLNADRRRKTLDIFLVEKHGCRVAIDVPQTSRGGLRVGQPSNLLNAADILRSKATERYNKMSLRPSPLARKVLKVRACEAPARRGSFRRLRVNSKLPDTR
jgi:hypothetical protein